MWDVTYVSSDSEIAADGLVQGDGGSVIVWADKVTQFYGKISARGGSEAGNGGLVEVSGKENLIFDGVVDVSASNGSFGTLLLDPTNIIISDEDSTIGVEDALPDIFEDELDGEITINASTLESQIGNVVLEATNDITIAEGVSLNFVAGESITFTADEDENGSGSFSMDPTQSITTNGRNLSISGKDIRAGDINTSDNIAGGGTVNLTATGFFQNVIEVGNVDTSSENFDGGSIEFKATRNTTFNDLKVGNINASSVNSNGGNVTISGGKVSAGVIKTTTDNATNGKVGGSVTFDGSGDSSIQVGNIYTTGGDIRIDDPISLTNNLIISTGTEFGGNIEILRGVTGHPSLRNLTLEAGKGDIKIFSIANINNLDVSGTAISIGGVQTKGDINLITQENLKILGEIRSSGNINIKAEERLQLLYNSDINSILQAGSDLTFEANNYINIQPQTSSSLSWFQSSGDLKFISNNSISANAHFAGGNFFSPNLSSSEGIISSQGNVTFDGYTGPALKVEAQGSIISTGNISITGVNTSLADKLNQNQPIRVEDPDIPILANSSALILRAGLAELEHSPSEPKVNLGDPITTFESTTEPSSGNIKVQGNIDTKGGPVILSATGEIDMTITDTALGEVTEMKGTINSDSDVDIRSDKNTGNINIGDITARRNINISGAEVSIGNISADYFNPNLNVSILGNSIETGKIDKSNSVKLESTSGNIIIDSISYVGGGGVDITSAGIFQAINASNDYFEEFTDIRDSTELVNFLEGQGVAVDELNQPIRISRRDIPISIKTEASSYGRGHIIIRHGGATEVDNNEPIVIQGDKSFVVGPIIEVGDELFVIDDSLISDSFTSNPSLSRNERYTTLKPNSDEFPVNLSGTVGGIFIVDNRNQKLVTSFQDRTFEPPSEVVIKEPTPEIVIKEPPSEVVIKEPTPEIVIKEPTPEIVIKEPTPEIVIKEPTPEVVIKEPTPEVVIKEPTPEIVIKEPTPEVVIKEPTPEIVIKEPTPEIVAPVTELPPVTETPPTTEQPQPDDQNPNDSENNNQEKDSQLFEPEERQANLENSCEDDKNSDQSDQEECEKSQSTFELRLLRLELTTDNFTDSTQLEINAQGQLEIKGSGIEIENLDLPANAN
ncbi:MAG: hypothetical protein F6K16_27595 [Symploca sp. SIO2B6]|nr:hypothetical protein [Symploca sp. SIO2B6]